jgi:hypothetical protein
MSVWLWVNLSLGALFVLAIVGVPLWLVLTRPDTGPDTAAAPAWRRIHIFERVAAMPAWRPVYRSAAEEAGAASRREPVRPGPAGTAPGRTGAAAR